LADESSALLLNMDGKSLRGTIPKRATQGLRLLAVQHTKQNAVVAQTVIAETENEISAAKRLLKKFSTTLCLDTRESSSSILSLIRRTRCRRKFSL
jgi:hypothetical protein